MGIDLVSLEVGEGEEGVFGVFIFLVGVWLVGDFAGNCLV